MSDLYDDERSPVEGVRILGAEEARASLAGDAAEEDEPEEEALLVLDDSEIQLDLRDEVEVDDEDDLPLVASRRTEPTWSARGTCWPGRTAAGCGGTPRRTGSC